MYADLHNHTHYSLYDGSGSPLQHILRAKTLGYPAIAITDHGSVSGWMETYLAAKEHGIKPVLGVEAYFQPSFDPKGHSYHMTMYAMNQKGYQNLSALMSMAAKDTFLVHGKSVAPIFTLEQLKKYNEGIIINSGCIGGYIPQLYQQKKRRFGREVARFFSELLGDRYYMEVMPWPVEEDGRDLQAEVNDYIINMAHAIGSKVIMTSDAHYLQQDHYESYKTVWEMAKDKGAMIADYTNLYLHSGDEMLSAWQAQMGFDGTEYAQESVLLAERCNVELEFKNMTPKRDWGKPSYSKLIELCQEGLKSKGLWKAEYLEQIKYEISVIHHLDKEDYMLICWDALNYARSKGITVGPGRGSVCGSLVAYAIGITNVDPIRFGTTFERFMHSEKKSDPDIDSDIDKKRRGEVIDYLYETYPGRSAQIITVGYYKTKILIVDLSKHYGLAEELVLELKSVFDSINYEEERHSLDQLLSHAEYGSFFRNFKKDYPDFLQNFLNISGQAKYHGVHPSGVAITPGPITEYVPLTQAKAKPDEDDEEGDGTRMLVTAYDMKSLDKAGILKLDILGLINLSIIEMIEKEVGCTFTYDILEDPDVYKAFCNLELAGVFQFDTPSQLSLVKKVQPTKFSEIMACNALVRPGCDLDGYLKGKFKNANKNSSIFQYTKENYGTVVYEEDKMAIARGLAGLSLTDTDKLVKEAKKGSISDKIKEKFIAGAIEKSGISEKEACSIVNELSKYAFNKGHAAGYSMISVYTMWLKLHHPLEFFRACLHFAAYSSSKAREYKIAIYEKEAAMKDIWILGPHINGGINYSIKKVDDISCIQQGLRNIPGIGEKLASKILKDREENGPYTSMEDFKKRAKTMKAGIGIKMIEKLIDAGALEFDEEVYRMAAAKRTGQIRGRAIVARDYVKKKKIANPITAKRINIQVTFENKGINAK